MEAERCGSCGNPRSLCSNPKQDWFPQITVCYSAMADAEANRRYDAKHADLPYHSGGLDDWSKEQSPAHPYGHRDGVKVWVAPVDLDPDNDFL